MTYSYSKMLLELVSEKMSRLEEGYYLDFEGFKRLQKFGDILDEMAEDSGPISKEVEIDDRTNAIIFRLKSVLLDVASRTDPFYHYLKKAMFLAFTNHKDECLETTIAFHPIIKRGVIYE